MSHLLTLIAEYRDKANDWSEHERAQAELAIWRERGGQAGGRREWFAETFGGSQREYEERYYLQTSQGTAPLWEAVEARQITMSRAVIIHREAKRAAAQERGLVVKEVKRLLAEYLALPVVRIEHGMPIHGRRPERAIKPRRSQLDPKEFRAKLRELIGRYVGQRLDGVHADVIARRIDQLDAELQQLLDDFGERLHRDKANANRRADAENTATAIQHRIRRRAFTEACRTLNITVPPPNRPIDLAAAKKAKRALVREYHPDRNPATRAAYEAVIEAYRTIETYAEENERG